MRHARTSGAATKGGNMTEPKARKGGSTPTMNVNVPTTSPQLWKRVGELAASSAFLLYLSDVGSDRLTLTQVAFFMLAATADAAGKPATRSEIIQTHEESFNGSIRNSYRQLLGPSRLYPQALGWLETETNPMDVREQLLRLTDRGKLVIEGALVALEPTLTGRKPN